jgi:NADH-quinone oxidoreductase subunit L
MSEQTRDLILWLIPGAPLAAALLLAFTGKLAWKGKSHLPCAAAIAVSFVCSLIVLFNILPATWAGAGEHAEHILQGPVLSVGFDWINVGDVHVPIQLRVDAMTSIMLAMVTGVSLLVAIFGSGYMHHDPGYPRFFAAVSGFVFSMCMLVMSGTYLMLFVFWEAVGVCSYLLIGFWFKKPSAAAAAKKAFVVNRIGDFGLILGIFTIWTTFGSLDFDTVFNEDRLRIINAAQPGIITTICLLLFVGAMGKSAQFPLHVWLPDAMEGPTPVSALIHAATMVTAGVYLVARSTPLYILAPTAQLVVAGIGAATALIAALCALTQTDLKRVMAYSTVSQLGFMFMALGAGAAGPQFAGFAVMAAMFHLFTHAYFKALLFLASGSVMHSMGDVIDMRRFSGLKHALPITHWTFLCGALALAGIPPLAGFWSKDEILAALYTGMTNGEHRLFFTVILGIACFSAFLTAFYTFRAYFMTFQGPERFPEEAGHHPHDAPPSMAIPLAILAFCAVFIGLIVGPTHLFGHTLYHTPGIKETEHHMNFVVMGISILIGVAGVYLAKVFYIDRKDIPESLARNLGPLYRMSYDKLYFDEIFLATIVFPLRGIAYLSELFDKYVIDKIVDGVGKIPGILSAAPQRLHGGLVQSYAFVMFIGVLVCVLFVIQALAGM